MDSRRRAWAYCAIDAPEDEKGVLKGQREQAMEYAYQMGFEVAGSSSDTGRQPLWSRKGFRCFVDAAIRDEVEVLIVASRRCLACSSMQMAQFKAFVLDYGLRVYSPLEGELRFEP